jgi:hypothetical protein
VERESADSEVQRRPAAPAPATETESTPAADLAAAIGNSAFVEMIAGRDALPTQGAGPLDPAIAAAIDARRGAGDPLPDSTRTEMEPRLGADLSNVRVHTDSAAATLNRAVQAEAFTVGDDVFFSPGRFDASSADGRRLLAHELTHVVQGPAAADARVSAPTDDAEREADRVAAGIDGARQNATRHAIARQATTTSASPSVLMTSERRVELRRFTGDRITRAVGFFTDACNANKEAVKAAARSDADWISILADVAMGFLAPALAQNLIALARSTSGVSWLAEYLATRQIDRDIAKQLFVGATKVGGQVVKQHAVVLAGETDTDAFIDGLKRQFSLAADQLDGALPLLTDDELVFVCAGYDPGFASLDVYRGAIRDKVNEFRAQVQPIGEGTSFGAKGVHLDFHKRATWIDDGATRRLAIVEKRQASGNERALRYVRYDWVADDMQELAIRRTQQRFGSVETVPAAQVEEHHWYDFLHSGV